MEGVEAAGDPVEAKGPKASVILAITAVVAFVAVGGAIIAKQQLFTDDDNGLETAAAPTTSVDDGIDVDPVDASPTRLFSRTTPGGIEIRAHLSDDNGMFGGGFNQGGDVPDWCVPSQTLSIAALGKDAIAQNQLPVSEASPPESWGSLSSGGIVESAPLVVIAGQVAEGVTTARLSIASGETDTMDPVDGIVALAVQVKMPEVEDGQNPFNQFPFGVDTTGLSLELLHQDGSTERLTQNDFMSGPPMWSKPECTNQNFVTDTTAVPVTLPPPTLPASARKEIPELLDRAAAAAEVERTLVELYSRIDDDDIVLADIDDPSGLDRLMDEVLRSDMGKPFKDMTVEVDQVGFFSAVEATFTYRVSLETDRDESVDQIPGFYQFGRARFVDGKWKITRSTVCADIEKSGIRCTI